ncbi:hypothetical protein NL676_025884 [Syzygium grande]|nr:hypothetical protein NL676_025884 [Syzygium grande]
MEERRWDGPIRLVGLRVLEMADLRIKVCFPCTRPRIYIPIVGCEMDIPPSVSSASSLSLSAHLHLPPPPSASSAPPAHCLSPAVSPPAAPNPHLQFLLLLLHPCIPLFAAQVTVSPNSSLCLGHICRHVVAAAPKLQPLSLQAWSKFHILRYFLQLFLFCASAGLSATCNFPKEKKREDDDTGTNLI